MGDICEPLYVPNGGPNPKWPEYSRIPYGQRLLAPILDSHAAEKPDAVMEIMAKSTDLSQGFLKITWRDLKCAVDRMSYWIDSHLGKRSGSEVFAYMGPGDIRNLTLVLAAMKTGFPVLLPSGRNSMANNLHLMEAANCTAILHAASYGSKAAELAKATKQEMHRSLKAMEIPDWDQLCQSPSKPYPYTKTWEEGKNDIVVVLHTSGSTGNPKPYAYSNRQLAMIDAGRLLPPVDGRTAVCYANNMDRGIVFVGFPPFHAAGLNIRLGPLTYDSVGAIGPPDVPANGDLTLEIIRHLAVDSLSVPPTVIEELVKTRPQELLKLSSLRNINWAGGPLASFAIDFFEQKMPHVGLFSIMGSTEANSSFSLQPLPGLCNWFEWYPNTGLILEPVDGEESLFELVSKRDPEERLDWCQGAFINHPELDEWRSRDLFRQHLSNKNLWMYAGRRDDVLVLSTGEKFNPVAFEQKLLGHSLLSGALVVGQRRFQCALILEAKDIASSPNVVEEVWPVVEEANIAAPAHGKIQKQMIMQTKASKPFPRGGKGTVMRFKANEMYAEEIEDLYTSQLAKQEIPSLESTDAAIVGQYVLDSIARLLPRDLKGDSDMFSLGMDSLQCVALARNLTAAIRPWSPGGSEVRSSDIYRNPTPNKLIAVVLDLLASKPGEYADADTTAMSDSRTLSLMLDLVARYSTDFPKLKSSGPPSPAGGPKNVIVTGTTGSLGYYLLLSLLKDVRTGTIYCLNRADAADASDNFESRYRQRKDKVPIPLGKVKFLKTSFGDDFFGLPKRDFDELLNRVDIIIHNAWKVNFNHDLTTFEPQIRGLRTFVSLSLSSSRRPSIYFTSSIGAVSPGGGWVKEVVYEDPKASGAMGYSQSKWVCENILDQVRRKHGLDSYVLRIGQIAGPVRDEAGMWKRSEWLPILVETSKNMGVVPELIGNVDRMIDWIPVDSLADIIVDIIHAPKPSSAGAPVYNLVNPRTVSFRELAPTFQAHFGPDAKIVSYNEWFQRLDSLDRKEVNVLRRYPALKLYGMFDRIQALDPNLPGLLGYETEKAKEVSQGMRKLDPISGSMAKTWLRQWKL